MTLRNPRQIIADYIWNEVDVLDLDDMGAKFGQDVVDRLDAAGWVIVPKRVDEQATPPDSQPPNFREMRGIFKK